MVLDTSSLQPSSQEGCFAGWASFYRGAYPDSSRPQHPLSSTVTQDLDQRKACIVSAPTLEWRIILEQLNEISVSTRKIRPLDLPHNDQTGSQRCPRTNSNCLLHQMYTKCRLAFPRSLQLNVHVNVQSQKIASIIVNRNNDQTKELAAFQANQ